MQKAFSQNSHTSILRELLLGKGFKETAKKIRTL
jgi:hypothetical protein